MSHGVVKLIPCLFKSFLSVRWNILSKRELLGVLYIQLLEQLVDHEPFKPQPKEVDRRVGPPVWGAPGPWLRVCFSWSFE